MIKDILALLKTDDFLGVSPEIEIAKGRYKIPMSIKEGRHHLKRQKAWQKKKH